MIGDAAERAVLVDRLGRVFEKALLEPRVAPGLGADARPDMRPDLGLERLDDAVERGGIDIAFLGQHGLERANAGLLLGQLRVSAMIVVMVVRVAMAVIMSVLVLGGFVRHDRLLTVPLIRRAASTATRHCCRGREYHRAAAGGVQA